MCSFHHVISLQQHKYVRSLRVKNSAYGVICINYIVLCPNTWRFRGKIPHGSYIFSMLKSKVDEIEGLQSELKGRENRISQLEGEVKQSGLDLKQLQSQLVVKEEQLMQTQENVQKVRIDISRSTG